MENFLNPETIVMALGYAGIFAIVFVESGLFFGFFLPGDSLLFSAGFLASQGNLNVWVLLIGCFIATFFGVIAGYIFGRKVGHRIFFKPDSFFFDPKNLDRTRNFYEKYGKLTILFSRFVPIVRTFAPIFAGIGNMEYKKLLKYNLVASIIWPGVVIPAGFFFGREIPAAQDYVLPVVGVLFVLTLVPLLLPLLKKFRKPQTDQAEK